MAICKLIRSIYHYSDYYSNDPKLYILLMMCSYRGEEFKVTVLEIKVVFFKVKCSTALVLLMEWNTRIAGCKMTTLPHQFSFRSFSQH